MRRITILLIEECLCDEDFCIQANKETRCGWMIKFYANIMIRAIIGNIVAFLDLFFKRNSVI